MTNDKANILVVDDLPEKLLVMESVLEELGEKFLGALGPSFLRVDTGPEGLAVHGHRILSSNGLLILLGAAGVAAATVGVASSSSGG